MFFLKRLVNGFHEIKVPHCVIVLCGLCRFYTAHWTKVLISKKHYILWGNDLGVWILLVLEPILLIVQHCSLVAAWWCVSYVMQISLIWRESQTFLWKQKAKKQCDGDAQWLFYLKKVHLYDFARNICYFFLFWVLWSCLVLLY